MVKAEKDQGYRGMEYEVELSGGSELHLTKEGTPMTGGQGRGGRGGKGSKGK